MRKCKYSSDHFCYVCGFYIAPKQVKHKITSKTKFCAAYKAYFGLSVANQDVNWAPHVSCGSCRSNLEAWFRGADRKMPFIKPRIWREPTNHHSDCYFCVIDLSPYKKPTDRFKIQYPSLPSSSAPIPHNKDFPVAPVKLITESQESKSCVVSEVLDDNSDENDEDFIPTDEPHLINQIELNDLVRDLGLTKDKAELLGSRLKQWNLLQNTCKISLFRKRHKNFSSYYTMDNDIGICYCSDVDGLFDEIGVHHKPEEWRLFIDSSVKSLKAVLLHNGNDLPSIPVGHSVQLKEDYKNVKLLLDKIKYSNYKWDVCGDFKMLAFFLGLQGGYTKYSCFLCLWDSRADSEHYIRRQWPIRNELLPGKHNVINPSLVSKEKILLPPLHIKLGLAKQFVKALNKDSDAFIYIRNMFPKLSSAKVEAGIFTGPQIKEMLKSGELENKMSKKEKQAWQNFRKVVEGFLGNTRDENYKNIVENMTKSFHKMGCRMSVKLHFLHSHLDFFRDNLGKVSEEHGERFHQDIQIMEKRYEGSWNAAMMGDYVWSLIREDGSVYKRKNRSNVHF